MLGKKGLDSWQAIKWIPRFLLFTLCLILVMYIFAMLINVDYDARGVRAESAVALLVYSDAFSYGDDPSAIDIERFTESSLEAIFPPIESEEESDDVIVRVLRFAPVSARLELTSIDGMFESREVYFEQETFERLRELYLGRDRSAIRFVRSENLVRVINASDPSWTHLGRLTVEVLV